MTSKEKRELRRERAYQNKEFYERLRPLRAKRYRTSLKYEDSLIKDDGKAYVNVDLTKIETPFSIFSYNRRIDPEIYQYIDTQVFYLRVAVPVVINFDDGGKYSDEMKKKIRDNVKRHYSLEYEDRRMEHRKSNIFGFLLLLVGLLSLAFHFVVVIGDIGDKTGVLSEITLIMSWMFIWQSLDTFFVSGHSKRIDIYNSGQLALAEVTFGKPVK